MQAPSTAIRINPFKPCEAPVGEQVPWNKYGRILTDRPVFTLDPLFHAGCYYVQDSSAMYVGYIFRKLVSGKNLRVLDLCAAPGGKTTDLACSLREICGNEFELVSNEVMKKRASVLADNVGIWGDNNVIVSSVDPAVFGSRLQGYFDVIVADVPCSGEGMFRKDAKAEQQWSPDIVKLCAERQRRILADVWPALKQDGILIYSTCTYEDTENDENLLWASQDLGGEIFEPEDEFGKYGVKTTKFGNLLKAGEVPGEGQWVGALRKTAPSKTSKTRLKDAISPIPRVETDRCLAIDYKEECPSVELDRQQALRFLHRDALYLPEEPKGLLIVKYQGHPLGFVNNLGSRCNNLHPKNRRILMDV